MTTLALLGLIFAKGEVREVSGTVTDRGRPVKNAAVWIEYGADPKSIKASVDQRNKAFHPHVSVVPVGSKVEFPNNDDIFHNVYAEFQAKRFDLGLYPKGQSKTVTFDKPGLVSIRCNIHSEMSAYIVVAPTDAYAVTDDKGAFRIKVRASRGTLRVWHESNKGARLDWKGEPHVEVALAKGVR